METNILSLRHLITQHYDIYCQAQFQVLSPESKSKIHIPIYRLYVWYNSFSQPVLERIDFTNSLTHDDMMTGSPRLRHYADQVLAVLNIDCIFSTKAGLRWVRVQCSLLRKPGN